MSDHITKGVTNFGVIKVVAKLGKDREEEG
jgi:hypothetical protein